MSLRRIACLVALLCAVALPGDAQAARPHTKVVLLVKGCEGCTLQPVSAPHAPPTNSPDNSWQGPRKVVHDGKVTFSVPTARTRGLYFYVEDPASNVGAEPLLVVRYGSLQPGTKVSKHKAAHSKRARHCWAGTTAGTVRWHVRVTRFPTPQFPYGEDGYGIRPYVTRTKASLGPAQKTWHGTIAAQDTAFCNW